MIIGTRESFNEKFGEGRQRRGHHRDVGVGGVIFSRSFFRDGMETESAREREPAEWRWRSVDRALEDMAKVDRTGKNRKTDQFRKNNLSLLELYFWSY